MKKKMTKEDYSNIGELILTCNHAVRAAQEENRRHGLPNVYALGNYMYYELPNGRITTRCPKILRKKIAKKKILSK